MSDFLRGPLLSGFIYYEDKEAGFGVWLPQDWYKHALNPGHPGILVSPYQDDINTFFLAEKRTLEIEVNKEDVDTLRQGFNQGMLDLPGVEVISTDETLSDTGQLFDAIYTYLEGTERRKRWMRCVYLGKTQLILIGQGRNAADFELHLSSFYKIMTTPKIL